MSSIVVSGDTSGSVSLSAPAIAGTVTVTLPSTSGTMAVLPTATGVLAESAGGTGTTTGYYGFKNRIINGAMVIDQRNAGASVTPNNSYTLDRWLYENVQTGKVTIQQNAGSVTPPTGFTNYLGVTSTSAYSVLTGDTFLLTTRIEGYNIADLAFGTASASSITLSFWVRSSLTGTFGGSFGNVSANRSYAFSYTISAANTWEQKTVTIAGDTSGTWNTTTGRGLSVTFGLGSGSTYTGTAGSWQAANLVQPTSTVSVVGTNGATWYVTGVQLEKGATATSFDYRPYGTELSLCQRYCNVFTNSDSTNQRHSTFAMASATTVVDSAFSFKTSMRTAPSIVIDTIGNIRLSDGITATTPTAYAILGAVNGSQQGLVSFTATGLTAFRPYFVEANGTLNSAKITFSAEL